MKTLMGMAVVLTLALAGCATTTEQGTWKDWGVCLQHGIDDAQNCDAWYDRGGHLEPRASRPPEPVLVAQMFNRDPGHRDYPEPQRLDTSRSRTPAQEYEALRRELQHEDHGRRLRDLERQIEIERSNDFYRQRTR